MSRPIAVFAYDFDGTLAPGNMQEHAFIPDELGMGHAVYRIGRTWTDTCGTHPWPSLQDTVGGGHNGGGGSAYQGKFMVLRLVHFRSARWACAAAGG